MPKALRLLLVDPQTLFRRCLAIALNRRRRLQVVGEAMTGSQAIELARTLRPDLVVVEPEIPGGGPGLVAALCGTTLRCAVLVLTSSGDAGGASRTLQAGARGYLRKDCDLEDLIHAVNGVTAGHLVVAPAATEQVIQDLGGDTAPRDAGPAVLTTREVEVLRLVIRGDTNIEIARELNITEHTAKSHVAKIRHKLGLANRVQLTAYALQQGIAAPAEPGELGQQSREEYPFG